MSVDNNGGPQPINGGLSGAVNPFLSVPQQQQNNNNNNKVDYSRYMLLENVLKYMYAEKIARQQKAGWSILQTCNVHGSDTVSYTHLTLPTIYSV